MPRPNILYIHSHDTGRYIQPYGHAIPTPRLQRLAEEGVLFRQAFCAAPTCSPSRAALLTGQAAHSAGMVGLSGNGPFALRDPRQHLAHTLRAADYVSAQCGVQHVAHDPVAAGYDQILTPDGNKTVANVVPVVVDWLTQTPAQPFFLDVGFSETHRYQGRAYPGGGSPFNRPGPVGDPRYCLPPLGLPDTPETRQDMADFKEAAKTLDDGVGAVLDALDAIGMADTTLVISTTDHGLPFPHMKCNLTDGGIGVSLIMRGPGGFTGGKVIDAPVSQIDLFPTLCDLLDIPHPPWLQGASLLPLIRDQRDEIHDAIFAEVTFHALYNPQRCVRTRRWKYVRRFLEHPEPAKGVIGNTDDGLSKRLWLEHGWAERPYAREALYDLMFDPAEMHNLVGDVACRAVLDDLRGRLERWMRETDDPLLVGPVPLPPGFVDAHNPDGFRRGLGVARSEERTGGAE